MSVQLPECAVCVTGDSAPPFFILCGLTLSSVSAENLVVPIVDQNKCHQHLKKKNQCIFIHNIINLASKFICVYQGPFQKSKLQNHDSNNEC